jgi:hypothetical protein
MSDAPGAHVVSVTQGATGQSRACVPSISSDTVRVL